jgi:O-methyltransferase
MLNQLINSLLNKAGYVKKNKDGVSFDYDAEFRDVYGNVKDFTMTSPERVFAMYNAVKYIEDIHAEGDIAECGVWRGGSIMVAALTLMRLKNVKRKFYLYDTYKGMSKPSAIDQTNYDGAKAILMWERYRRKEITDWCYASISDVRKNVYSTLYPKHNFIFVKGDVGRTIPKTTPKKIALLRLDTDWYKSTKHELEYLYPKLVKGGVLIIDDYGHWKGAKVAVDEYFKKHNIKILLNRIDYTGRLGIKI